MIKNKKTIKLLVTLLFLAYIFVLIYYLFFSEGYGRTSVGEYRYNLVPFSEIKRYFKYFSVIGIESFMLNIVGNVVAFVPFGLLIPIIAKGYRKFFIILFDGIMFTVIIESVQLILKVGSFDVDDMILNTMGVIIGYIVFKLLYAGVKKG